MSHYSPLQCLFISLFLVASYAGTAGAATNLYLRPDFSSPLLGVHEAEKELETLSGDTLLSEEAAAQGWRVAGLRGEFEGYVENSNIRKDLSVSGGTPVYLEPQANPNLFLTVVENPNEAEILGTAGDWTEIALVSRIPVYYREPSTSAPPTATDVSRDTPPQPEWSTADLLPFEENDNSSAPLLSLQESLPTPRAGEPRRTPGELRLFEGRLEKTRRFLWFGPSHPYQLVDIRGNRIALLDPRNLLVTASLERYIGSTCIVFGRISRTEDEKSAVILVENIRLKTQ